MSQNIAFIGLGNMGHPMCTHLARNGFSVFGYDVSPDALSRLQQIGGTPCATIEEAVREADYVISMVPTGRHVRDVHRLSGLSPHWLGPLSDNLRLIHRTALSVRVPTAQRSTTGPNIIVHKAAVSELPAIKVSPIILGVTAPKWEELQHVSRCSSLVRSAKDFMHSSYK